MGGLIGYQLESLQLILSASSGKSGDNAPGYTSSDTSGTGSDTSDTSRSVSPSVYNQATGQLREQHEAREQQEQHQQHGQQDGEKQVEGRDAGSKGQAGQVRYLVPPAINLTGEAGRRAGTRAAAQGIMALPFMAEILPAGGEDAWQRG